MMGRHSGKKERQRVKRQESKRMQQRRQSGSPYQRIGRAAGAIDCYINEGWQTQGMASITVRKEAPAEGGVLAAFLVDLWCIGLKDAWGRIGISRSEFEEAMQRTAPENKQVRVDLAVVKRLVAGSIRFARQNGFRLPAHYERWVKVLGGVGDIDMADLSDFGIDGGLRYMGPEQDLRERLIGCRLQDFLARPDVHVIFGPSPDEMFGLEDEDDEEEGEDEAWDEDEDEDDEEWDEDEDEDEEEEDDEGAEAIAMLEQATAMLQDAMADRVRQWCFAQGEVPHPRLEDALDAALLSIIHTSFGLDEDKQPAGAGFDRILSALSPAERAELEPALEQVVRFMSQFSGPEEMISRLGLDMEE